MSGPFKFTEREKEISRVVWVYVTRKKTSKGGC